ncbi:hypothetical protein Ancab_001333 [Ancistrocladus abbreviatus]
MPALKFTLLRFLAESTPANREFFAASRVPCHGTPYQMSLCHIIILELPPCFMVAAAASRPLLSGGSPAYTTLTNSLMSKGLSDKEIKNSLPKGFQRSSAPSRYTNRKNV